MREANPHMLESSSSQIPQGWKGWDDYAPFYDWENARTLGRRDVPFWRRLAIGRGGRVLELGCGTGRVLVPIARAGVSIVGIDRSAPMLTRARSRLRRLQRTVAATLIRGDIRALPFGAAAFDLIIVCRRQADRSARGEPHAVQDDLDAGGLLVEEHAVELVREDEDVEASHLEVLAVVEPQTAVLGDGNGAAEPARDKKGQRTSRGSAGLRCARIM